MYRLLRFILELFASDGEIFALLVFLGLAVYWKKPNVLKCAVGSFFAWHTTPEYQEQNRAFLPNSEMKIIKNVGHDLIWIKPEEHVKLIKEYLDELN